MRQPPSFPASPFSPDAHLSDYRLVVFARDRRPCNYLCIDLSLGPFVVIVAGLLCLCNPDSACYLLLQVCHFRDVCLSTGILLPSCEAGSDPHHIAVSVICFSNGQPW